MTRFLLTILFLAAIAGGGFVAFNSMAGPEPVVSTRPPGAPVAASPVKACVNMGGALEAPNEGEWGYTIRETDLQLIRSLGMDTVRIPVKWSAHASNTVPFTIEPAFFNRVDEVIQQALDADLKVILDVHHYDELNRHPNGHLPRLYALWDQISTHYQGWPDGLIFEFLNEPHSEMTFARVDKLNRDLLALIREKHPDRWVIIGGGQWGTLEGLVRTNPPYDPKAMVTFHYYEPFDFTHQGAPWVSEDIPLGQSWGSAQERQEMAGHFEAAARWRDQVGMPVFVGEFGVYQKARNADRAAWTEYVRRASENVGFGWCYWDWATSLQMYDLENERLLPGMAEALLTP